MWVKVDDGFVEHMKVAAAAAHLGPSGFARVVAVWLEALCYSGRNLTDGFVPTSIARRFITDRRPLDVLEVMAMDDVRLMKKVKDGFAFHDFEDYQPTAKSVKDKRARDRRRKVDAESQGKRGGFRADSTWNPAGIFADSARIPTRSRARDPDPTRREKNKIKTYRLAPADSRRAA